VAHHRAAPTPGASAGLIAFGSVISDPAAYVRYARPGIEAATEPGATVLTFSAVGSVCRNNNLVLDAAAGLDDLEALVLVDEHVELKEPHLCATLRSAFRDPAVAVVGWMGATGVRSIAWWEGRISRGPVQQRFHRHGGGELTACSWTDVDAPPAEVDAVDGRLMALSPWAVQNLRFDEELSLGFGYDVDFCLRVRTAGRKVATAAIRAVHHHELELVPDHTLWAEAHIRFAEKWDGRIPGVAPTGDWKARARRAEAERDAARTRVYSAKSIEEARLVPLERELARITGSASWRVTAPLRALNRRLRRS
jgi:glycosyl transferase family 2